MILGGVTTTSKYRQLLVRKSINTHLYGALKCCSPSLDRKYFTWASSQPLTLELESSKRCMNSSSPLLAFWIDCIQLSYCISLSLSFSETHLISYSTAFCNLMHACAIKCLYITHRKGIPWLEQREVKHTRYMHFMDGNIRHWVGGNYCLSNTTWNLW